VQERDAAEARVAQLTGYITGFVQLLDRQQAVVKRYEAALRDERLREALVVCLNRLREYGAPEHDVGVVAALDALEDPRPFAKCQGGED
jgi:hypothetical protein